MRENLSVLLFSLFLFFLSILHVNLDGKLFVHALSPINSPVHSTPLSSSKRENFPLSSSSSVASSFENVLIGEMHSPDLIPEDQVRASKPMGMSLEEWKTRLEAAILYRLFYA